MFVALSRMKIYLLVIVLSCFAPMVASEVNYVDCGSSFEITYVYVEGCTLEECIINTGETRFVEVYTKNLDPEVDDMETRAFLTLMGQRWELSVTPDSPCVDWGCPLRESRVRIFKANIDFSSSLIKRTSLVTLETTFDSLTGQQEVAFCIQFRVELI